VLQDPPAWLFRLGHVQLLCQDPHARGATLLRSSIQGELSVDPASKEGYLTGIYH